MSSPLTATFLQRWLDYSMQPVTLVKIELTSPSTRTLRLATEEITLPDGTTWEPALQNHGVISARADFMGSGLVPTSADLTILNRRLSFQSSGTIASLLSQFVWQGATVTIYYWEKGLTNVADLAKVFKGTVNSFELTRETLKVSLLQRRSWAQRIPNRTANKTDYPNTPDARVGTPLGIYYGDFSAQGMRGQWGGGYGPSATYKAGQEDCGGALFAVPGVQVDTGVGANAVKIAFASHTVKNVGADTNGTSSFVRGERSLSRLDVSAITGANPDSVGNATLSISDDILRAYAVVTPTDVRVAGGTTNNSADNPKNALDMMDETTYASLDQAAGKNALSLIVPDFSPLGYLDSLELVVAYSTTAANLRAYVNGSVGVALPSTGSISTPAVVRGAVGGAFWTRDWRFFSGGAWSGEFVVDFSGGAGQTARIYFVGLVPKYRPTLGLVQAGKLPRGQGFSIFSGQPTSMVNPAVARMLGVDLSRFADVYNLEADFYANLLGYIDDGSGNYSGTASALLQRPPDIARHALVTYGGLDKTADFETGAGAFGSFVDARTDLKLRMGGDFLMSAFVNSFTDVAAFINDVAAQSLSMCFLDRFDDKFKWRSWERYRAVDFRRTIYYDDILGLKVETTDDSNIVTALRVRFGYDHFTGRTTSEAAVNGDASAAGIVERGYRDQKLIVTAGVDDSLTFTDIGAHTVTLTAGTYTPRALAAHVMTKLNSAGTTDKYAWYGVHVTAGSNDALDFSDGSGTRLATVAAGAYATPEEYAIAVQTALNAAGSTATFTVAYDWSTQKFTITASANVTLKMNSGANKATSGYTTLGNYLNVDSATTTTFTSGFEVYPERFYIIRFSAASSLSLARTSGSSVVQATYRLLGYDYLAGDINATAQRFADFLRGDRETTAAAQRTTYGEKAERVIDANFIRDSSAANDLRDRIFDLANPPRQKVTFQSTRFPDMQIGRVIQFSSEIDSRWAYPGTGTDGSWAGKRFTVIEVHQAGGPNYTQEIVAISQ